MNNVKIPVEVDPAEDTEWNDILRDHGIIPERPKSPTEELEDALSEAVRKQHENRLENKTLAELNELDDDEDEEFLQQYKLKRFQEIQSLQRRSKFGTVQHVTKPEYAKEVTNASDSHYVFVHMSLQLSIQSRLLSSHMITLALKFPEIKFVEIPASRCVENYPEENCPTIIIYLNKNIMKQYVTLTQLGGNNCELKDLERVLVDVNAIDISNPNLEVNQQDEDIKESRRLRFVNKSITNAKSENSDDDDYDSYD